MTDRYEEIRRVLAREICGACDSPINDDGTCDCKEVDFFSPGARLALELECLLMDTRDAAVQSRWWDSAHEALEQWRQAVLAMEAADAAQRPADHQKVVFIDGVGAGRSSIKSCRDGVQWVMVGNRVYWPLSDADAQRLQSACCGNGSFDGPASSAGDCVPKTEREHAAAREIEALRAEVERLSRYYKNGIACFANPCERHSGERTPPFAEFFEKYGGQCLICVVDNSKALQAENERLAEALKGLIT